MTVNCPTFTKKIKPCFVCGSLEHGAKQCTKVCEDIIIQKLVACYFVMTLIVQIKQYLIQKLVACYLFMTLIVQ